MSSRLRILHLDGDPNDTALIQRTLGTAGLACELVRVDTRRTFVAELRKGGYHLILADGTLPGLDGLTALAAARHVCPEVPFIILSRTVGEELAIDALKDGATDYVRKQRLSRLVPATRRALQEAAERASRKWTETALRESEERFRATFEQAAVGIAHVTPEGRFLRVNRRFAELVGFTPEELCERTIQQLTYPPDLAAEVAGAAALLAGQIDTYTTEKRYVRRNGALIWVSLTMSLARNAAGACDYVIGVVQDISARKEAEAARQEAEQRFSQVFENVGAVAIIISSDECITYCNPHLLKLTGWTGGDVIGRNWFEIFLPADQRERVREMFLDAVHGGVLPTHYENAIVTRDGRRRLIAWSNTPLRDTAGRVIALASLGYDITEQRQAEQQVRAEQAKLRGILDAIEDAVCIIDPQHHITYANPAFVRQLGPVDARPCYVYFHGRSATCPWCKDVNSLAACPARWEWSRAQSGRVYDVFQTSLRQEDGALAKLQIMHDITARTHAEASLARRTQELETLMEHAPDLIVRLDRQHRHVLVNRTWSALTGRTAEEALGRTPRDLGFPPEVCDLSERMLSQAFATGRMQEVEYDFPSARGRRRLQARLVPEPPGARDSHAPTVLVITRDVTEQQQLEEELSQAQKMEVVGQLAAGIAHDINNMLTAILGYAALARTELPAGHAVDRNLEQLEDAAQQAAGIVKGMLTFSHKTPTCRQPVELRAAVQNATRFLSRVLPATVEVVVDGLAGPPLWVSADTGQLQQVLMNLAINARDAMPDGGTLRISLQADRAGELPADPQLGSHSARAEQCDDATPFRSRFCSLTVSDTGPGIAPDVLPRIFEPFFTTKPPGQGTGLGLAIVRSVVERHDGTVTAHSQPGQGATFTIGLPCIEAPAAAQAGPPEQRRDTRPPGRGELILIVDDHVQVLDVITSGLRQMGYDTLPATNAPTAAAQCARYGPRVRLAILDVDLPDGSGVELLREMRRALPALSAVLITGNVDSDLRSEENEQTRLFQKPFGLGVLLEAVAKLLEPHQHRPAAGAAAENVS
jgi:two-component system cell cycle sensor histidine kinase/response regulator CckA